MYKKFVSIGVLFVMVLSVTACSCNIDIPTQLDRELLEYKTSERTEIEAYAESKGKDNYTAENWAVIEGILALAKSAIDVAADKAAVGAAVAAAEQAVDAVQTKQQAAQQLAGYKAIAKTTLELYAESKGEKNYSDINWAVIYAIVAEGTTAINAAAEKDGVDAARKAAEQAIDTVEEIPFPTSLEEYSDKFFDKYTLILLPIAFFSDTEYLYLKLTTVFVGNDKFNYPREYGKLNYLVETTITDDTDKGVLGELWSLYAIIIPNEIFSEYDIVRPGMDYDGLYGIRGFSTNYRENGELIERSRDIQWLKDAEENSVKHQKGLFLDGRWSNGIDEIMSPNKPIVVTSVKELNALMDYFSSK